MTQSEHFNSRGRFEEKTTTIILSREEVMYYIYRVEIHKYKNDFKRADMATK